MMDLEQFGWGWWWLTQSSTLQFN